MLVKQICKDKPLWFQAASAPFWLLCSISFLNNLLLHQLSALRPRRHRSAGLDTLVPPHVNRIWNKNSISSPLPMSYRGEKPTWSIYRRKKNPILLKRLVGRLYSTAWKLIAIKPSRGEILPALDGVLVEKKKTWKHGLGNTFSQANTHSNRYSLCKQRGLWQRVMGRGGQKELLCSIQSTAPSYGGKTPGLSQIRPTKSWTQGTQHPHIIAHRMIHP